MTEEPIAGQLCEAIDYRWVDLGDGTVLDCNTGLIWLKDASCLGQWPYAAGANTNIFDKVTDLNNGENFPCADYEPGTYTDWRVPEIGELCSDKAGTNPSGGTCPPDHAVDSLMNTNFSNPVVGNASGAGQWSEGDAFVGVQSRLYWSATGSSPPNINAWNGTLFDGVVFNFHKGSNLYVWPVRGGQ